MMNVLYIADENMQSGAIKSFEEVVSAMHDEFHVKAIVCTSQRTELNERLETKGIQTIVAGYGSYMQNCPITWWKVPVKYLLCGAKYFLRRKKAVSSIERAVDMSSIDLIHTNVNRIDVGTELSRRNHIPHIMHIREFGQEDFKCWSYRKNYIQYLNDNVTKFIAISQAVSDSWHQKGIAKEKLDVIYNGVDSEKIKKTDFDRMLKDKQLRMVIVGGVIPAKGQIQAIHAIAKLKPEISDNVSLDIIGWSSSQYFKIIESEIEKYHLKDRVRVLGAKSDVYDRLCDYHIGLMCSQAEGFGRVTVEYMHAGLGVIASRCGANPEIIQDGVNGLMYEYGHPENLSLCIEKYYNNREMLMQYAKEGQKNASEKYTKPKNAANIFQLYSNIIR